MLVYQDPWVSWNIPYLVCCTGLSGTPLQKIISPVLPNFPLHHHTICKQVQLKTRLRPVFQRTLSSRRLYEPRFYRCPDYVGKAALLLDFYLNSWGFCLQKYCIENRLIWKCLSRTTAFPHLVRLLELICKKERYECIETSISRFIISYLFICCSDGAGRSGTFISIAIILERFKTEQLIDVFQTVKKIRAFQPQFVENVVSLFLI